MGVGYCPHIATSHNGGYEYMYIMAAGKSIVFIIQLLPTVTESGEVPWVHGAKLGRLPRKRGKHQSELTWVKERNANKVTIMGIYI